MPSPEFPELEDMSDDGYDELVSTARLCILTGYSYLEVRDWPDVLRAAFTDAWNDIQEESK